MYGTLLFLNHAKAVLRQNRLFLEIRIISQRDTKSNWKGGVASIRRHVPCLTGLGEAAGVKQSSQDLKRCLEAEGEEFIEFF